MLVDSLVYITSSSMLAGSLVYLTSQLGLVMKLSKVSLSAGCNWLEIN
jgi:hypothetical protein